MPRRAAAVATIPISGRRRCAPRSRRHSPDTAWKVRRKLGQDAAQSQVYQRDAHTSTCREHDRIEPCRTAPFAALSFRDGKGAPPCGEAPFPRPKPPALQTAANDRSEEHTSELQSLMRISYAVFCLKKKTNI